MSLASRVEKTLRTKFTYLIVLAQRVLAHILCSTWLQTLATAHFIITAYFHDISQSPWLICGAQKVLLHRVVQSQRRLSARKKAKYRVGVLDLSSLRQLLEAENNIIAYQHMRDNSRN
jgi:hypothetical protein